MNGPTAASRRLRPDERSFIAREVRLGIPLWTLANCWGTSEENLLKIAGLTRGEQRGREAARKRLLPEHPELADLNRAVVAAFREPDPSRVEDDHELVRDLARVVREADEEFEKAGGGTRHWVRDHFLPHLQAANMRIARESVTDSDQPTSAGDSER